MSAVGRRIFSVVDALDAFFLVGQNVSIVRSPKLCTYLKMCTIIGVARHVKL